MTAEPKPDDDLAETHLIVMEEEAASIEFHFDEVLVFLIFWGMALVVFLQFFSRYVLNSSAAWTEEIARYLLMWVTFIGASVVTRRGTHISVEILSQSLPAGARRLLAFFIDCVTVGFMALLAWFSITITERMAIQRMTVIDWSMSLVYAGISFGCFLMLFRAAQRFLANARRGWRPDPNAATLVLD